MSYLRMSAWMGIPVIVLPIYYLVTFILAPSEESLLIL